MKNKSKLSLLANISALVLGMLSAGNGAAAQHNPKPLPINPSDHELYARPGFFRLVGSENSDVCSTLLRLINGDIQENGKIDYKRHKRFAKWRVVQESDIDRGSTGYDGSVEQSDFDVNGDGVVDKLIRSTWSISGIPNDALSIFQGVVKKPIRTYVLPTLENTIAFNTDNAWLKRQLEKNGGSDWFFDGVAALNVFQHKHQAYVVAENFAAPPGISAKVYVFRLGVDFKPINVCMFFRICPCGGCEDLRGDELIKFLPSKEWCSQ